MSGIFNPGVFNHSIFNTGPEEVESLGFATHNPVDFVFPAPGYPLRLVEVYRPVSAPPEISAAELHELMALVGLYASASRSIRN